MERQPGIPTFHDGFRFRSRLEAMWARFFDLVDWPWKYEPFDLAGYIPDFVMPFPAGDLLIEVKPEVSLAGLRQHCEKTELAGWNKEILIVGSGLLALDDSTDAFGLLREVEYGWDVAEAIYCFACQRYSLYHSSGRWNCRLCGKHKRFQNWGLDLRAKWAQAQNLVQWAPRLFGAQ